MARVRVPWGLHRPAGSLPARGASVFRIRRPPISRYDRLVTVDLDNDGIALPVTFSGAGTATALVGPFTSGESWALDQAQIWTSVGPLDAATATLYAGAGATPNLQVASLLAGGGSQVGLGGVGIQFGEFVIVKWTGGTPGATGSLRVTGRKTALA